MARSPRAGKGKGGRRSPPPQSAYEKRIAKFLAAHPGSTRQQARGHKPREHVARRERELAAGVTTYHRSQVRKFALKQANRMNLDPDSIADKLIKWTETHGYDRFREYRGEVAALGKLKRERFRRNVRRDGKVSKVTIEGSSGGGASAAKIARMENLVEEYDLPDLGDDGADDWHWFFYN